MHEIAIERDTRVRAHTHLFIAVDVGGQKRLERPFVDAIVRGGNGEVRSLAPLVVTAAALHPFGGGVVALTHPVQMVLAGQQIEAVRAKLVQLLIRS